MRYKVLLCSLLLLIATLLVANAGLSDDLSGATIVQGGVAAIEITDKSRWGKVKGMFTGGKLFAVDTEDGAWAIIAADIEAKPGSYKLEIRHGLRRVSGAVKIIKEDYGVQRINKLPSKMVEPDAKTQVRIAKEVKQAGALWEKSSKTPLWDGPFIMPLKGRISGTFGTRRILNGKPKSPHSGMDIAAPEGTTVKAANSGKVVFVEDFYYKGTFVVVDHGLGVFTEYSHLSEALVKVGDSVKKGSAVGKVGATGRATGPHLHFGAKVGGLRVSPEALFEVMEALMPKAPKTASNK